EEKAALLEPLHHEFPPRLREGVAAHVGQSAPRRRHQQQHDEQADQRAHPPDYPQNQASKMRVWLSVLGSESPPPGPPPSAIRHSSFVIPSSFVIRLSAFAIRHCHPSIFHYSRPCSP